MMRALIASCLLLAATPVAHAGTRGVTGAWTATVSERRSDRLEMSLRFGHSENDGAQYDLAELAGLTGAQLASSTRVPVEFELRREAGTVAFDGTFREGAGAGQFTFTPNHDFPRTLRSLGVDFEPDHGDADHELFVLTLFDVSSEFIRSMQAIGYKVDVQKYVEFRIFKVDPDYVRDMNSVGFRNLSADKLVETKIHGATPDYIRERRAKGDDLSLDDYIQERIFQITPEFADEIARAGYANLDHDKLVQFKIQGVTPEFIQQLRDLGYTHVAADDLVAMRIHGVSPEFIRRVNAAGYKRVPIEKLVQMRIFGIEPEMVKALDDSNR